MHRSLPGYGAALSLVLLAGCPPEGVNSDMGGDDEAGSMTEELDGSESSTAGESGAGSDTTGTEDSGGSGTAGAESSTESGELDADTGGSGSSTESGGTGTESEGRATDGSESSSGSGDTDFGSESTDTGGELECPAPSPDPGLLPCGDGQLDPGEVCDDGPLNGEAGACDFACGFVCEGPCPLRVDVDAPPGGDGSSWARAFDSVQGAIDSLAGCGGGELWVAEGVYVEDPQTPVATVSAGVELYGGFSGVEVIRAARDWDAHPTTLGGPGQQSSIVVAEAEQGSLIVLDGFEITGGAALEGGGVSCLGEAVDLHGEPALRLRHDWIHDNHADEIGGGLRVCNRFTVEILDSVFEANHAAGDGGAIATAHGRLNVDDTAFISNSAGGYGGAVSNREVPLWGTNYSSLWCTSCLFTDNAAGEGGGAVADGVVNDFSDSRLEGNSAKVGGGLWVAQTTVDGSAFVGNEAETDGGAIWLPWAGFQVSSVSSSTFVANTALTGSGGALYCAGENVELDGVTYMSNTAGQLGGGIFIATEGWWPLQNQTFIDNYAGQSGGAAAGSFALGMVSFLDNGAGQSADNVTPPLIGFSAENVIAWPSPFAPTVPGDPISVSNSCVSATAADTANVVYITENPFLAAEVDADGVPKLYVDPSSGCADLGTSLDPGLWQGETTDLSQCTDAFPADAGRHYAPTLMVGECP